jgi:hypothetical protein
LNNCPFLFVCLRSHARTNSNGRLVSFAAAVVFPTYFIFSKNACRSVNNLCFTGQLYDDVIRVKKAIYIMLVFDLIKMRIFDDHDFIIRICISLKLNILVSKQQLPTLYQRYKNYIMIGFSDEKFDLLRYVVAPRGAKLETQL